MDSVLLPIPSSRIEKIWPLVSELVDAAVSSINGRLQVEDVKRLFLDKDWVLWVSIRNGEIEAIAATEVLEYKRKKMCAVRILTGKNYANWVGLEEGIANWAKSVGCHGMESQARKGWAKIFKNYDFTHIFLERMF